ncbi:MAG: hypothetical protein AB8B91_08205 [Rubripirellula sp.]
MIPERSILAAVAAMLVLTLPISATAADELELVASGEMLEGSAVSYLVQRSDDSSVILNANNGFFDKGAFRAEGQHVADP